MILYENGSASFDGMSGTWHADNGKLYLQNILFSEDYDYYISNNKLYLKGEYYEGYDEYVKR